MEPNANSSEDIPFYEQVFTSWQEEDKNPDWTPTVAKFGLPDYFLDEDITEWRKAYYIFATKDTFPEPTEYCYPCAELSIRFTQDADRIAEDNLVGRI